MYPELVIIRHGETEWNRARRWQGWLDSPLTEKGEAQAREMGRVLAAAGITSATHSAFVSPLGRARATARLAFGAWEATPDDRLKEIGVGQWQGLDADQIMAAAGLPDDAHPLDYYEVAPGGEGFGALKSRVLAFLTELKGPAVLFTHGITSRMIRTLATGGDLDRLVDLPGGQGVIFRVRDGRHEVLANPKAP